MRSISRTAIAGLAVVVALAVGGGDALAKGKGNKGGGKVAQGTVGTVTAVDSGSLTLTSKKQGSKTFTMPASTVYKKAAGKKKQSGTPATLADVKTGERVRIKGSGDQAKKVIILKGGKHGGGKGNKNK